MSNDSVNKSQVRIVTVADTNFAKTLLTLFVEAHADMVLVGEARDGEAAVQVALQSQPDMLLMDFNLLLLDGIASIRQIKVANPRIRIILLTAENDPALLKAAIRAGADIYLPHLTLSAKLAETVRRLRQAT